MKTEQLGCKPEIFYDTRILCFHTWHVVFICVRTCSWSYAYMCTHHTTRSCPSYARRSILFKLAFSRAASVSRNISIATPSPTTTPQVQQSEAQQQRVLRTSSEISRVISNVWTPTRNISWNDWIRYGLARYRVWMCPVSIDHNCDIIMDTIKNFWSVSESTTNPNE